MQGLEKLFNEIAESKINKYSFNLLENRCVFLLETLNMGKKIDHVVEIKGIMSFVFFNNTKDEIKKIIELEKSEYHELSTIGALDTQKCFRIIDKESPWLEQFESPINLYVEIWNKFLFVYASEIIIDNKSFLLD